MDHVAHRTQADDQDANSDIGFRTWPRLPGVYVTDQLIEDFDVFCFEATCGERPPGLSQT